MTSELSGSPTFQSVSFNSSGISATVESAGLRCEGTTIRPIYTTQVKQIAIVPTQIVSYVGDQIVMRANTVPENASRNFVWSSSDESIAEFFSYNDNDKSSRFNLVSPGTVTITVTALDGNVSASCQVTVRETKPNPMISASPTEIDFGYVQVGSALGNEAGRVEFTNIGDSDLSITKIIAEGPFSYSPSLSFPIVIAPGSSKTITFAFKPTEPRLYSGYIKVFSNATNDGILHLMARGYGIE